MRDYPAWCVSSRPRHTCAWRGADRPRESWPRPGKRRRVNPIAARPGTFFRASKENAPPSPEAIAAKLGPHEFGLCEMDPLARSAFATPLARAFPDNAMLIRGRAMRNEIRVRAPWKLDMHPWKFRIARCEVSDCRPRLTGVLSSRECQ